MASASVVGTQRTPAARAIARLNTQLLALADADGDVPAAEIERTAKAITSLIRSVEQAEGFLASRTVDPVVGERLSPERERALLRRVKALVDQGLLDGLDRNAAP